MLLLRIVVFVVIGLLIFSPFLLVLDYERFSSFVLLIWLVSVAYYLLMVKRKAARQLESNGRESEGGTDPDVSRETSEN